jgi:protein-tyrosine-phosphatase
VAQLVLFVCTGNQCRSPMAEALLGSKLGPGSDIGVGSAGTAGNGTPPPDHAVRVMADAGLVIAGRPSRPVEVADLEAADLVIAMTRQQLVDVATRHPSALERSFPFLDLVDRARRSGGRLPDESVRHWARRMSTGRDRSSILKLPSSVDIPDPMGGRLRDFERTFAVLDDLTAELAGYLQGIAP